MRAQTVEIKNSQGRILCCTVFRSGGKKLLAKGHVISDEDIRILESEGMENVWVTELEEGEVGEDDAVTTVASEMGCGCYEIRMAAGGRANLVATENCCVLVDDELLKQLNCTASVVIATSMNFSFAIAGQRIATVKSAPFAVSREQLDALLAILKERGPILQARPIRQASVAVLYTDPTNGERARQLFESIMRQRLERFCVAPTYVLACAEDEAAVSRSLQTPGPNQAVGDSSGIDHRASRPGGCDRPRDDPRGWIDGAVSRPSGTGQPHAAGVQGRGAYSVGARLFPFSQAECD